MLGKVIPNIFFESSLLSVLNSRGGKMRDPGNEVKSFLLSCSGRIFPLNMFLSPIGYPNYGEETVLQPFQLRFVCQITVKTYLRPLQFKSCSMRDLFVSEVRKEKQTRKNWEPGGFHVFHPVDRGRFLSNCLVLLLVFDSLKF